MRSKRPHDWTKFGGYFTGAAKKAIGAGQEYYRAVELAPGGLTLQSYWLPDDRTIVVAPPEKIIETFSLRGPVNEPHWAPDWRKVASEPAALAVAPVLLQAFVAGGAAGIDLSKEADMAFFGGRPAVDEFLVTGMLTCRSEEMAVLISKSLETTLGIMAREWIQQPGIPAIVAQVIDATQIESKAASVRSQTRLGAEFGSTIVQAGDQARAAALENHSSNKMKQLGIAMQNYHDAYKHFPPAVLIGPDGKTPYSWRVALLPFLEKNDLYQRYRKDEPWDSEHNKSLIPEATELFSVPTQEANDDCGYFLITGPGTVFDANQPPSRIRNIRDGSSKTIGLVEAKRSIPWTKPEDIAYDPAKPLPKLGGYFEGGYRVGLMDASVHVLPEDIDEATFRALITRAGREPVAIPAPMNRAAEARRPGATTPAARRAQSVNTMKRLGIAMHNYHDKNGHFPSNVVMGPDGKTPQSWRVALLPYFEEPKLQKLFEQYNLDEPWDSENNRKIIEGGAEFFGTALETQNGDSCYFMLAGPGTMADPQSPNIPIRSITDGTSRTIYFVEAKRSIPWTKPEDIEYHPDQPLPKLGGFFEGGFDAAYVDGSVHFLPDDLDEPTLRALLSTTGGERIESNGGVPKVQVPQ